MASARRCALFACSLSLSLCRDGLASPRACRRCRGARTHTCRRHAAVGICTLRLGTSARLASAPPLIFLAHVYADHRGAGSSRVRRRRRPARRRSPPRHRRALLDAVLAARPDGAAGRASTHTFVSWPPPFSSRAVLAWRVGRRAAAADGRWAECEAGFVRHAVLRHRDIITSGGSLWLSVEGTMCGARSPHATVDGRVLCHSGRLSSRTAPHSARWRVVCCVRAQSSVCVSLREKREK